jgi:RNA polymerase sigma factor (sigma-70 family)
MSALRAVQAAPTFSEHELISAVRRGDDRAFEELYSRYRPRIGSYVFGMVGDHQRAEDIAQEVFIAALRRLRATERPIAFKPWIYEIAKNACINEFRRARRSQEVPLEADGHGDGVGITPARLIADGADAAVEHKQRLDDLRRAFHGLSDSHHRIIVMRELEGRSYTQIGESLGMTKPVVESTLFRARRKLSEEYEELVTGRRCDRVQSVIAAEGECPLRSLRIKERRLLARHLAHCQPCRRHARMAGVDESFFKTPSIAGKIAALLPIPWLRFRRGHGDAGEPATSTGGERSSAAIQSLQNAAVYVNPSGPAAGIGRMAAAAAAIVVAGAGGGLVTGLGHHGAMPAPRVPHVSPVRASHPATTPANGTASPPVAAPAPTRHSAPSSTSAGAKHHSERSSKSTGAGSGGGSGGGSGSSAASTHTTSTGGSAGGSAHASATKPAGGGSAVSTVTGTTGSAGSAVHNPLAAAAGTVTKILTGGGSSGSSGSGTGTQLPKIGPVQLPKLPVTLPKPPSSSTTSVPQPQLPAVQLPKVPGLPDPNKVLSGLTGH